MLQEGPSESFNWKNKLNELERLPTEPAINKTASWEKLHRRLSQKQGGKRILSYWMAAACVLVVLGLSWLFTTQKTKSTVSDKNLQHNQHLLPRKEIVNKEPPRVDTQRITSAIKITQKRPVVFDTNKNVFSKTEMVTEKTGVTERDSIHEPLPEIAISVVEAPDTIHAVVTLTPPSMKKLRVVHINELGKSMVHEAQLVKSRSPGFIGSKNLNDALPVFSMSKNASDNLVKIKLSPSN